MNEMHRMKKINGYSFHLLHVLGSGSYGKVFLGKKDDTDERVAIKMIEKSNCDDRQKIQLHNEIDILRRVNSEHIVKFIDTFETGKNYYVVQELCDCDLSKKIVKRKFLPEEECIGILTQICRGFLVLHKEGIIHRDLKPANIFQKGDVFKIGDFGFSKQLWEATSISPAGSPLYMSLELLNGKQYTSKCDIWALGFIFYELLHGETPWRTETMSELIRVIEKTPLHIRRTDLSANTIDFIEKCLQKSEQDRISWQQLYSHPIFKGELTAEGEELKLLKKKLKHIMTKLDLNLMQKQSITELLAAFGYSEQNKELNFEQYFKFLQSIAPITEEEAKYIFRRTDLDSSGSISIKEITNILQKHSAICMDFISDNTIQPPIAQQRENTFSSQPGSVISKTPSELRRQTGSNDRIDHCFGRIEKIISQPSLKRKLKNVFKDFDQNHKNYLDKKNLGKLMTTMLKTITEEDVNIAFALIDVNQKNIIDFDDFRKFYVTINKLPNDAGKSEIQPYPLIKKMSSRQDNESDSRKFDERENHSHTSLDKRKVSSPVHTREKS